MVDTDTFKPRTFCLFANSKTRSDEIHSLETFIDDLPLDTVYTVKVTKGQETRKDCANRLYQSVIGQLAKQLKQRSEVQELDDCDPDVIAGKLKYYILLPLKLVMAAEYEDDLMNVEAQFEQELCNMITASKYIIGPDLYRGYNRAIRSKTLNTKPFSQYLNTVIERVTTQGFVIKLKPSERDYALGEFMEGKAA